MCTRACWCRRTATRCGGAAAWTATAPTAPSTWPPTTCCATPTTTCSRPSATRWTSWPRRSSARAAGRRCASASRWTTTTSAPPPTRRCKSTCRRRRLVDATALVNWQRAVKSPQEIAYMRIAARIVENMHRTIVETIEPGMRKNDLVAEDLRHRNQRHRTARRRLPGDRAAAADRRRRRRAAPDLGRHARSSAAPAPSSRSPAATAAITARSRARCISASRRSTSSKPSRRCSKASTPGSRRPRPGNTCGDIASAFFDVLRRHGIDKSSRCGYPIGISYPPDWGERTMSLRPGDKSVLEPGMTFHFMPGICGATTGAWRSPRAS